MSETVRVEPQLTRARARVADSGAAHPPTQHRFHIPFEALSALCGAFDGLLIVVASMLGGGGYQLAANGTLFHIQQMLTSGLFAAVLYVFVARSNGIYQFTEISSPARARRRIVGNWLLVMLFFSLMAFVFKIGAEFSRGSIICFAILALLFLLSGRWSVTRFIAYAMAQDWVEGRRAIVIGSRDEFASLDASMLLQQYGLSEIVRAQVPADKGNGFALTPGAQAVLADALERGRCEAAAEIVLAMPWSEARQIELVREALRASPLPVQLLPDRKIRNIAFNPAFAAKPSFSVEVQRAPLSKFEQLSKRLLDITGALAGLILFAPLMLVAAVAVKVTSAGPVLFKQRRNGFNTEQFVIYKFRTMKVMEDGDTIRQARKTDPRITPVGRLLRQSSIDELPQLVNVLKGEMSLVGPRPHALAHDNQYGQILSEYAFRHHVKPGITGWAQVNGYRGETPRVEQMKRRVELDLRYINNWSFLLDLKIIAGTCIELMRRRNAY